MSTNDQYIEICIKNGFFVKIIVTNEACIAEFPANIFVEPNIKALSITYIMDIPNNILEIYPLNMNNSNKKIHIKKYLIRPLIILSIMLEAKKRFVSHNLILLYKNKQYYKLEDILQELKIELNEEEQKLEKEMLMLVPVLIYGNSSKLEPSEDGDFLCDFLESGGF